MNFVLEELGLPKELLKKIKVKGYSMFKDLRSLSLDRFIILMDGNSAAAVRVFLIIQAFVMFEKAGLSTFRSFALITEVEFYKMLEQVDESVRADVAAIILKEMAKAHVHFLLPTAVTQLTPQTSDDTLDR